MRPLQAHCHRGLGTLYATTGQREQARAELSTAIEMYRAMDMTFWLPQTEAALAQVEGITITLCYLTGPALRAAPTPELSAICSAHTTLGPLHAERGESESKAAPPIVL